MPESESVEFAGPSKAAAVARVEDDPRCRSSTRSGARIREREVGAVGSEASTLTTVVIVVVLPTLSVPVSV